MLKMTDKVWNEWHAAFVAQGIPADEADRLASVCERWLRNNPGMTWQDIFDDALLLHETTEGA